MTPRWSAEQIARNLTPPGQKPLLPTPQQRKVIEAPLGACVVIAGAGSGKTETMAARVVWLVANGLVPADRVLGLTFTRKAAGELKARIDRRLRALREADMLPDGADIEQGATVMTYHSYAARLVSEHGLLLGVEPDSQVVGAAEGMAMARSVIDAWPDDLPGVDNPPDEVARRVSALTAEMGEHLVTADDLRSWSQERIEHVEQLLRSAGKTKTSDHTLSAAMAARLSLLDVADEVTRRKRDADMLEFSDQMSLAARLASTFPRVRRIEQDRYGAVLLDEFQDTSEAQMVLIASLFAKAGLAVTAVGDPNQAIYGFRGASAAALPRFREAFSEGERPAPLLPLATSWRNPRRVLGVANAVAEPLRGRAERDGVPVEELTAPDFAGEGTVHVAQLHDVEGEAGFAAEWLTTKWADLVHERRFDDHPAAPSAAVLCRTRAAFPVIAEALEKRGFTVQVVGLGGLLSMPEVRDLASFLAVVSDPGRGDALMRLLTGPLCRLGARDLHVLSAWRRGLARVWQERERAHTLATDGGGADDVQGAGERAPLADVSLAEAIDDLPPPSWHTPEGSQLSEAGRARVAGLAQAIRSVRRLTTSAVPDIVAEAERALGLDIEVAARPGRSPGQARANLDAFASEAASYAARAQRPTLAGLVSWLDAAETHERGLEPESVDVVEGAVQLMTVHAAKGLEWDLVVVPQLRDGTFPSGKPRVTAKDGEWRLQHISDSGWLTSTGDLPFPLRGDRDVLPDFDPMDCADLTDLREGIDQFKRARGAEGRQGEVRQGLSKPENDEFEERRLAYVAFTRAKKALLLTNGVVKPGRKAPGFPSPYLLEAKAELLHAAGIEAAVDAPWPEGEYDQEQWRQAGILAWVPLPPADDETDEDDAAKPVAWPAEASEYRLQVLEEVQAIYDTPASTDGADQTAGADGGMAEVSGADAITVALAEEAEAARSGGPVEVEAPPHLATSDLVRLARDPRGFATDLRRPMPRPPSIGARRGTDFHAWVEEHFQRASLVDADDLPGLDWAEDEATPGISLARTKELFLASEWADQTPVEIELAVETRLEGYVVRGRVDAVFPRPDGGVTVVDWKTGAVPTGEEARIRALQLGVYRFAYAQLAGVDPDTVDGAFYYADTGRTVRPELPPYEEVVQVLASLAQGV